MADFEERTESDTSEDSGEITGFSEDLFSEDDGENGGEAESEQSPDGKPKKSKKKKIIIILAIIAGIIVVIAAVGMITAAVKKKNAAKDMYTDTAVEIRTIQNTITGSSSIEPNDSYDVNTMVSGDITSDYFSEGDTVKKGDSLYQFDDEDARKKLTQAENSLTEARQKYVDAVKQKAQTVSSNNISLQTSQNSVTKALNTLEDARDTYNDQYVRTTISGKVKEVNVSEGDTVNSGAQIATIYDDSYMKLRLPFNETDAAEVYIGAPAEVTVTGSGDTLYGTVTAKASAVSAADAHTTAVYVTIEAPNPGALTESDSGSAVVNGVACADTAKFEYKNSEIISAKASGTLENLSIAKGDGVYSGEQIAYINSSTAQNTLTSAQLSYDDALLSLQKQVLNNDTYSQDSSIQSAQLSLENAQISLEDAQDSVDDYRVEAPIEGTVVTKNAKAGDTIDSSNSQDALCVIYDLSCVKLSIDVDETEIGLVKVGQKATITADAVDGEFEGKVIKVPVNGVNQNGVTTYTIEIQIDEYGDLLPGMNVDAEIVVEEAENVLTIPVNSVNRGNIVFVKDDGQEHENDVTDIINSKSGDDKNKNRGKDSKNAGDDKNSDNAETESGGDAKKERSEDGAPDKPAEEMNGEKENPANGNLDASGIPGNIEIPEGYRAILVETGINDTNYIEIKSGLKESDTVRTLNTESSSAGASFGGEEEAMQAMQGMGGMGGMGGGGMPGGGGGMSGGGGGMPGGGGGGASRGGMR